MFECTPIELKAKDGSPYYAIDIEFPNGYKKRVFLDRAEQYLLTMLVNA